MWSMVTPPSASNEPTDTAPGVTIEPKDAVDVSEPLTHPTGVTDNKEPVTSIEPVNL